MRRAQRDNFKIQSGDRSPQHGRYGKWLGIVIILLLQMTGPTVLVGAWMRSAQDGDGRLVQFTAMQPGFPELTYEPAVPTGAVGQRASVPVETGPTMTAPLGPGLESSIEGINFNEDAGNTSFYHIPPDPIAAAGLNHVVSVVNTSIEWHTKSGVQQNSQSLKSFFTSLSPATNTFDPKVIYDQFENRFVVVTLERTDTSGGAEEDSSFILLAVSDDDDPNGSWYFHKIDAMTNIGGSDTWADYPGFAVDEEAIYITNNMFTFGASPSGEGVRLWIVDKGVSTGFYAGSPAAVSIYDPYSSNGIPVTTQPAHVFGTPPAGIGTFLVGYSGLTGSGSEFLQVMRVDDPLVSPTFSLQYVVLGNIDNTAISPLPDAPQSGTVEEIATNDRRALHAVWRDDSLWTTTTVLPVGGPDSGQATAHWIRVDTSNLNTLSLADQGNIGGEEIADNAYTFFPSIAVDACGNAGIGFSASAASIFPGAYYTVRYSSDASGSVQSSETLAAGLDYYVRTFSGSRNRWGDYSGASLDPANEASFWVFNEYALSRGNLSDGQDGRWGTRYGQFASGIDFGDLPAEYGMTRFADDGARHCIGSPMLGIAIDPESDGQESSEASGDDLAGSAADEDGITVSGAWTDGTGSLNVQVSGGRGCLTGWIDFDRDNTFDDSGEDVAANIAVDSGTNVLNFNVPVSVNGQVIRGRFRLVDDQDDDGSCTDQSAPGVTGLAGSGEVEDYQWSFAVAPADVDISGPDTGFTGSSYRFQAAVYPISVTLPLTYTWQALDQTTVVTTSSDLTDTVEYSWSVVGTYPVTVTVENQFGSATSSRLFTATVPPPVAPESIAISGPTGGLVNTDYEFEAQVSPISTTVPLTYTWEAAGQTPQVTDSSMLTDTASFNWTTAETYAITVTVENQFGSASSSRLFTVTLPLPVAPESIVISGPADGLVNTDYEFAAQADPISTTLPLTYTWEAVGQVPQVNNSSSLTDSVTYSWEAPGTYPITVTAENEAGSVSSSFLVDILSSPMTAPISVTIDGPAEGGLNSQIVLLASVTPISVTTPLTYTWQADEQEPVIKLSAAITDQVAFSWDLPGLKAISVSVENDLGLVAASREIQIWYQVYLPLSTRE